MPLIEHLEKLRHFYRLVSYRSIKSGAKGMGISQAGLSKSIASLESVLEVQLFTRSNDGLVLTKEGEVVLNAAKKILNEANTVETHLRSLKAARAPSKFKIGMYDSIAIYLFPNLCTYLREIYPCVELALVVDRSSNLQSMVHQNQIDLALGVCFTENSNSKYFQFFEDHYSFYTSSRSSGELTEMPIIFHPDASDDNKKITARHLSGLLATRLAYKVYNLETIKELTTLGCGIGVLPTRVANPLISQQLLIQVRLAKMSALFGKHSIGLLATKKIVKDHQEFVEDICRLSISWSKS